MRKLKFLFVILMALFILPVCVFAEDEEVDTTTSDESLVATEESKEVHLYFFRGEGCSHCAEAEAWFESIEEEYGSLFEIIDYETWYNSENADLMQQVADARGETAEGVPYIIVGNRSWNGFTDSYKEEILSAIQAEYDTEVADRYDIMKLLGSGETKNEEKSTGSDVAALIIILLVVGGICFGVYKARNN